MPDERITCVCGKTYWGRPDCPVCGTRYSGSLEPLYQDPDDPTVRSDSWTIQNVPTCEWALMRVAMLKAEQASIEAAAAEAKRRIDAKAAYLTDRLNRGVAFFESQIAKYATENREALLGGSNRKSRNFLHGTVGWRKREGRLVVVDEEALRGWLAEQSDVSLFRVKIEPEMKMLQENFKKNGVIPPGCEYVATTEKLYIEPDAPEGTSLKGTK